MFSWLCMSLWIFPTIMYLDMASAPADTLCKNGRILLPSSSSGLPQRMHMKLPIVPGLLAPGKIAGIANVRTCAGSLTHPFKNQQGQSWVEYPARDAERGK